VPPNLIEPFGLVAHHQPPLKDQAVIFFYRGYLQEENRNGRNKLSSLPRFPLWAATAEVMSGSDCAEVLSVKSWPQKVSCLPIVKFRGRLEGQLF